MSESEKITPSKDAWWPDTLPVFTTFYGTDAAIIYDATLSVTGDNTEKAAKAVEDFRRNFSTLNNQKEENDSGNNK